MPTISKTSSPKPLSLDVCHHLNQSRKDLHDELVKRHKENNRSTVVQEQSVFNANKHKKKKMNLSKQFEIDIKPIDHYLVKNSHKQQVSPITLRD